MSVTRYFSEDELNNSLNFEKFNNGINYSLSVISNQKLNNSEEEEIFGKTNETAIIVIENTTLCNYKDNLECQKGDVFYIEGIIDYSRISVRSSIDPTIKGALFLTSVRKINSLCAKEWFFENLSKEESSAYLLMESKIGKFMIRPCSKRNGCFSLAVRRPGGVSRFSIKYWNQKYKIGERVFNNLEKLTEHYKNYEILDFVYLTEPISKNIVPFEKIYKELNVITYADLLEIFNQNHIKEMIFNEKIQFEELFRLINGEWKACKVSLRFVESKINIISEEKRICSINLKDAFLYFVGESIYKRNYVFKIVLNRLQDSDDYVFSCNSECEVEECLKSLSVLSNSDYNSASRIIPENVCDRPRIMKSMIISLRNVIGDLCPNSDSLSCFVFIDKIQIYQTQFVVNLNGVFQWHEIFNCIYIPNDSKLLSFKICSKYSNKISIIGAINFNIKELVATMTNENIRKTFTNAKNNTSAIINYSIQIDSMHILPFQEYLPLIKQLTFKDFSVLSRVCDLTKDRHSFTNSVLRLLRLHNLDVEFIVYMACKHIENESYEDNLFRSDSMASFFIDVYMRNVCGNFITFCLEELVHKVYKVGQHLNLDFCNLNESNDLIENFQILLDILSYLFDRIISSSDLLPSSLKYIFFHIRRTTNEKWPNDNLIQYRVVSAFLFLRFICISLINPKSYNIISETPSFSVSKTLTLLAKCLQKSSNLTLFSNMDSIMEALNPFLKSYNDKMLKFIDKISSPIELDIITSTGISLNFAYDCSNIHRIFYKNLELIKVQFDDNQSANFINFVHIVKKIKR